MQSIVFYGIFNTFFIWSDYLLLWCLWNAYDLKDVFKLSQHDSFSSASKDASPKIAEIKIAE